MSQKTLNGEDIEEEDDFWAEGSFVESISPEEMRRKNRTIHMKHDEEMNYNCIECHCKISAHNKDGHAGRCDDCFDKMLGSDEKEEFVLLGNLLKEDNDPVKELKTLFKREDDYQDYLGAIEFTLANCFLKNKNLKDKYIKNAIKNLKKNYLQNIDLFETELEKEIMFQLSLALKEKSITHHELKLVFDYILWSIDNRSWMPDKQAYVKWLPYFFNLYDKDDKDKYKKDLTKTARRLGISQAQLNDMLNLEEACVSDEQKEMSKVESEFFSLDENKKFEFVLNNGLTNPYLVQTYILELEEKQDYQTIEKLCRKMMELTNNFPMIEFLLGLNYNNLQNIPLAIHHMENALKSMELLPSDFFPPGERKRLLADIKQAIKDISQEGKLL